MDDVLVIIVNYNGGPSLNDCVESVQNQGINTKIVIVDNNSTDGSEVQVKTAYPDVVVRQTYSNLGYGAAVNLAVSENSAETIAILNPDVILKDNCLERLLSQLRSSAGVVGPTLNVSGSYGRECGWTINHIGMPTPQSPGEPPLYLPGCVLVTTREVFSKVGGFDSRYFLFVEDVEFCWRVLLCGFEVSVAMNAEALHEGGGSAKGGYLRHGAPFETTDLRVALRERNEVAMMISCAPAWWLPIVIPIQLLHVVLVSVGALALRRPTLSKDLLLGIVWNARQVRSSLSRRRSLERTSAGSRNARSRIVSGTLLLKTIRSHGLPKFV